MVMTVKIMEQGIMMIMTIEVMFRLPTIFYILIYLSFAFLLDTYKEPAYNELV